MVGHGAPRDEPPDFDRLCALLVAGVARNADLRGRSVQDQRWCGRDTASAQLVVRYLSGKPALGVGMTTVEVAVLLVVL